MNKKVQKQLIDIGIKDITEIIYNPSFEHLYIEENSSNLEGFEKVQNTEFGAVNVMTGIYTGRSPKDKYILKDETTKNNLWWTSEFSKNEIVCNLKGNYSSAFINGIMKLNDSKKHEIRSKINHLCENTKSYQLVKSTLEDEANYVYQGKIFVDKIAQKTDGYQLSKAILLNEATEFNGKPELEIYADDVKCSHGSTSGNLDENKIFYLMTRGLNPKRGKKIIIRWFLS